jgi:hypothetical protein
MRSVSSILAISAVTAFALPAAAHHSAAQFDFSQTVMIEGTVRVIEVRNPHVKLILDVEKEDGTVKEIEYEGHSRNNIYRRGWRPEMVEVGDSLTIGIAPMRDGSDGGYVTSFKLQDGSEF